MPTGIHFEGDLLAPYKIVDARCFREIPAVHGTYPVATSTHRQFSVSIMCRAANSRLMWNVNKYWLKGKVRMCRYVAGW